MSTDQLSAHPARPLAAADILDGAIRLLRRRFIAYIGAVALVEALGAILFYALRGRLPPLPFALAGGDVLWRPALGVARAPFVVNDLLELLGTADDYWRAFVEAVLIQSVAAGALIAMAGRDGGWVLAPVWGRRVTWRRFVRLISVGIVAFVLRAALGLVLAGLVAWAGLGGLAAMILRRMPYALDDPYTVPAIVVWLAALGALAAVGLPLLWLYARLAVVAQAVVLEDCDALRGLGRSWGLTRGAFRRIAAVMLGTGGLTLLLIAPAAALQMLALSWREPGSPVMFAGGLLLDAALVVALPLRLCAGTLLYYDLCIRREGYDLEELRVKSAEL